MGFMDGIRDVLGGFNAVKQIDTDGFDFREKRAAAQAARDQAAQQYEQQNEDYLTRAGSEAMIGGMPEEELGGMLPADLDPIRRKAAIARMVGGAAQSKSALKDQDLYRAEALQRLKGTQGLDLQDVKSKDAQELENLRAKNRANMPLSPGEQARLTSLERIATIRSAGTGRGRGGSGGGSGRWKPMPATDLETGEQIVVDPVEWRDNPDKYGPPLTVGQKERSDAMAGTSTAFQEARSALERYDESGLGSQIGSMIPGVAPLTNAGAAWEDYRGQLKMAATRVGRLWEGSRQSDQDRVAYAEALSSLNQAMMTANPEAGFERLKRAEEMMARLQKSMESKRRKNYSFTGGGDSSGGIPSPKNKAERDALPPGTRYKAPNGQILVKR